MILVCGGAFQGKREWAVRHWTVPAANVEDGREYARKLAELRDSTAEKESSVKTDNRYILDHFEAMVWELLQLGIDPEKVTEDLLKCCPDLILITDEIGSGIIPMEREKREYRELHGRLCCRLAREAEEVYRVVCGIAVRIKPGV